MTLLFLRNLLEIKGRESSLKGLGLLESEDNSTVTIVPISNNLYLVPASFKLRNTEKFPIEIFKANLAKIINDSELFDVVLIDAQAGVDEYAQISAELSDVHIIVSEYDPVSAQGIDRLKILFAEEMQPDNTFILFNKVLPEFAELIGSGLAIARYLPPIPWDAEVVRAFAKRDLAINMEAPNAFTLTISSLGLSCLPENVGGKIADWRQTKREEKIAPAKNRLFELNLIKNRLEEKEKSLRKQSSLISLNITLGMSLTLFFGIVFLLKNSLFFMSISSISYVTIFTTVIGTMTVIIFIAMLFWRDKQETRQYLELRNVTNEIIKLNTTVTASEAAMKTEELGPYGTIRRQQSS